MADSPTPAPNVSASTLTLEQLAYEADRGGNLLAAEFLLDLAIRSQALGGRADFYWPSLGQGRGQGAQQSQPGFPDVQVTGGSGGIKGLLNLDGTLEKALARTQFKAQKTPHRINATLLALGAYDGLRDPAEATNRTFLFLQRMARHPIIHAIINTRVAQVTRFAHVSPDGHEMGFEVRLRDTEAPLTRAARKRKREIEDLLLFSGVLRNPDGSLRLHPETGEPGVWDGNGEEKAMGLRQSLAVETRDSLSLDWSCCRMETGVNAQKVPMAFWCPVDSAHVRRTEPTRYGDPRIDWRLNRVAFAETSPLNDREVIREHSWETMSAMVRNRRTDWLGRGYGLAEIEIAMEILLSMINGLKFQEEFYSTGHIPYGLLQFQGMPSISGQGYMDAIRQEMLASGGGANWWNIIAMMFPMGPSGKSGNAVWTPLRGESTGELQFVLSYWNLLLNILCAIFQISPEEIGFEGFSTKSQTMSESDPQSILEHSGDKGINPLLDAHEERRNQDVVWRIDPDFEMHFTGRKAGDEKAKEDLAALRMGRGWTPNQVADLNDEPRQRIPLDPTLYEEVEGKYSEEDFDTSDEYRAKVAKVYEKKARASGMARVWSGAPNLPVNNPAMMQIIQAEQAENQQAIQAAQGGPAGQEAPGQGLPGMPGGAPGQAPGQPEVEAGQGGDLEPRHFLNPYQEPGEEQQQGQGGDPDQEALERYKRASQMRFQQAARAQAQGQGASGGAGQGAPRMVMKALSSPPRASASAGVRESGREERVVRVCVRRAA